MSFLAPYGDFAAENGLLLSALGITIGLLFLLACIVSLRRKVSRQQKELERLSRDVADLRLAEETRFFAELKHSNTNNLRIENASAKAGQLDVVSSPPLQISEDGAR
jgi:hypothetical protein